MAERRLPSPPSAEARRLDFWRGYRQLLYSYLAWPMLAVLLVGGVGTLLVRPELSAAWTIFIALVLSGAFLKLAPAVILGGAVFVTAVPFFLTYQSSAQLSGDVYLLLVLLPFAPIWLAAARVQQVRATRLQMLLRLPQVRAALDVSDWSLLPKPHAIDQRLHAMESAGGITPAVVMRIHFRLLTQARSLLGESQLQQSILELADQLRLLLRAGDLITEDIPGQQSLYVLAFSNPEVEGSVDAFLERLVPTLRSPGLSLELEYASYPDDGKRLRELVWHRVEMP